MLLKPVKIRVHIGKTCAPLFCPHSRVVVLNLPNAVSLLYSSSCGVTPNLIGVIIFLLLPSQFQADCCYESKYADYMICNPEGVTTTGGNRCSRAW